MRSAAASQKPARATVPAAMCRARKPTDQDAPVRLVWQLADHQHRPGRTLGDALGGRSDDHAPKEPGAAGAGHDQPRIHLVSMPDDLLHGVPVPVVRGRCPVGKLGAQCAIVHAGVHMREEQLADAKVARPAKCRIEVRVRRVRPALQAVANHHVGAII